MCKPQMINFNIPEENNDEKQILDLESYDKKMLQEYTYNKQKPEIIKEEQIAVEQKKLIEVDLLSKEQRAKLISSKFKPMELSSKGKTYPKNAIINFTEYSAIEVEKISKQIQFNSLDMYEVFELILQGISTENMDKEDLTFEDFILIALNRKAISIDEKREYYPICEKCGSKKVYTYSYNEFETHNLEIDLPVKEVFEIKNSKNKLEKLELEFKPLTLKNYFKVYKDKNEEKLNAFDIYQCTNKNPQELLENEFNVISIKNSKKLENISKKLFHGFKHKEEECKEKISLENEVFYCDNIIKFEVDDDYSIILPFF